MLAPERRTRADILTAVAIAAVVAIAILAVVLTSGVRGTHAQSAAVDLPAPATGGPVPSQVQELWNQPDGSAMRSLVVGGVAVTADGGTVTGRNPRTGEQVWRYERDIPLCKAEVQFGTVIATYKDDRGCSQTTLLNAETGTRVAARSSYMDKAVTLWPDGTYVLALGDNRMEMWRSDLVRTLEYGYVDAPVNPRTQPRSDCTLLSAESAPSRVAVLEHCPKDAADRLTILNPAPKDSTSPEEYSSHVLNEPGGAVDGARVLAVSDTRIALYLPGTQTTPPVLTLYDVNGNLVATHQLSGPMTGDAMVARLSTGYFVFTGENLIALNPSTLDPLWGAAKVLGTPALMAGQLIVPVADGLATLDPNTGAQLTRIPLQRSDYHGQPISLAVSGTMFLERRGTQLYGVGGPAS
ncbi:PQQ-binding-like beta-propeller repeat protein [Nocardia sp. NPDC059240]|uniref:Rv3212 family protein n=1 Tax=Nocardia sp. NPDC059240 TaxID=3346786 RepID=UPI0036CC5556